ncbi:MAG: histidine kinase dimerization/phospho-acceptor domain-containing protein [Thermomonas sp.]|uniref:sensor histidine kinase n=1 Tax=Thermomonas sp. TaxID=1971895 RepID=UPI0039E5EAC6
MPHAPPLFQHATIRRERYFFTLYRLFEAALLCLVVFSPVGDLLELPRHPTAAKWLAAGYLLIAVVLFVSGRHSRIRPQVLTGIGIDIWFCTLAMYVMPSLAGGIAMLLLFNVGAAALLLPARYGLIAAACAVAGVVTQYLLGAILGDGQTLRPLAELLMFAVSYLAIAALTGVLGAQMRASEALAEQRGSQAANLAEINELIIRRMRTGVLLVDGEGEIRLANEAALIHLGDAGHGRRSLATCTPELKQRLHQWQRSGSNDATPLQLKPDQPEVLPRFARLLAEGDQVLIFLDDASLASRRAETLTLATLGRFSASLAHEIRNPLAAISYATQLLQESRDIPEADLRLLEIIYQQTHRMNGIVENVLGLARRERAQPEQVDLREFTRAFVADYLETQPPDNASIEAHLPGAPVIAMVDRRQLQQIVTVLVHNALVYGRMPGEPARIGLHVHLDDKGAPLLDVTDRGPGIPEAVAAQLFRPFFTTSSHGTGLGLYIAHEMCEANQSALTYVPVPGGGACFRIRMAGTRAIETR